MQFAHDRKQCMNGYEITCKKAFRKLKHRIGPYEYDMNIYRGCAHHCRYCYAQYSQRYMDHSDFYRDIYVKTDIAEKLEQQLASPHWGRHIINIGSVSDSYQPLEAKYQMMRKILPVLIRYRTPCIISTKSDLILRDLDLIDELAAVTYVNIAVTITTTDEETAAILEPHAVKPLRRKEVATIVKQQTRAIVGVHAMPIMPMINDDEDSLRTLMEWICEIQADYAAFGSLHLHGVTKHTYMQLLQEHFPQLVNVYQQLYKDNHLDRVYAKNTYQRISELAEAYGVCIDYMKFAREYNQRRSHTQLTLFDESA